MTYEERQQLKSLFTIALYQRYDQGEVFMKTADCLELAHNIIDEFYKRSRENEKNGSNGNHQTGTRRQTRR